jgi:hypothetical protein
VTGHPLRNDLAFVLRVADLLEGARLRTWLWGGWGEELRGLSAPREHTDVDLLYPGRDFERVDRFIERSDVEEWVGKRRSYKRAFELEGVLVELLLVQRDERGWFTDLPGGRHFWPGDVFSTSGRLPVASVAALQGFRSAHAMRIAARAA